MAETDDDARALAPMLLIDMHREVGRGALNPNKAFMAIYSAIKGGLAAMIFDGEELIGSVGLVTIDFWYSDDPQLVEQWAYIKPEARANRAPLAAMFEAVQHIARSRGEAQVNMIVFNEKRTKARSPISHIGEQFSFVPAGAVIEVAA